MPISDCLVVQYLLQETGSSANSIQWQETEEGYVTHLNGVRIEFGNLHTRTASRFCVIFSCAASQCFTRRVQVVEPVKSGLFRPGYDREEDRQLAELLRELHTAIRRQAYDRKRSGAEDESVIREMLYKRLLGSSNGEVEP